MSRKVVLAAAVVVAVVAIALAVVLPRLGEDEGGSGADVQGVEVYRDLARDHVTTVVEYPQVPPVGGAHWEIWMECGVYDAPLDNEFAVHDLEHGSIWITYDADEVSDGDVAALEDLLPDNGILSPYVGQPAPIMATAWGRQLVVEGPDDPQLQEFIDSFESAGTSPEPEVRCNGGLKADQVDDAKAQLGIEEGTPS